MAARRVSATNLDRASRDPYVSIRTHFGPYHTQYRPRYFTRTHRGLAGELLVVMTRYVAQNLLLGQHRAVKIYTKTGDAGDTGLFGGARVSKDNAQVEAYGDVDELNSVLGMVRTHLDDPALDELLAQIQARLFDVGAELATAPGRELPSVQQIGPAEVEQLETSIDSQETHLPPLTTFVLPGGTPGAAAAHHARTVCRRAERRVVSLNATRPVREALLHYLNRLSDFLFVLARTINHRADVADVPWIGRRTD